MLYTVTARSVAAYCHREKRSGLPRAQARGDEAIHNTAPGSPRARARSSDDDRRHWRLALPFYSQPSGTAGARPTRDSRAMLCAVIAGERSDKAIQAPLLDRRGPWRGLARTTRRLMARFHGPARRGRAATNRKRGCTLWHRHCKERSGPRAGDPGDGSDPQRLFRRQKPDSGGVEIAAAMGSPRSGARSADPGIDGEAPEHGPRAPAERRAGHGDRR
jgi:hypothetical protein